MPESDVIEPEWNSELWMCFDSRAYLKCSELFAAQPLILDSGATKIILRLLTFGEVKGVLPGGAEPAAEIAYEHPTFLHKLLPDFRLDALKDLVHVGDGSRTSTRGRLHAEEPNLQRDSVQS